MRGRAGPTLRALVACVAVVLAAIAGISAVPGAPAAAPASASAGPVLVVGVPGLRWDDIDERRTPRLWRLAGTGSVGALSVRSAGPLTCPADGWVTLAAGNRARGPRHGGSCPTELPFAAPVETSTGGLRSSAHDLLVARNAALKFGARLGALADGVRCVGAVGEGAAVAASHPVGRIDWYRAALPPPSDPALTATLLERCPVTIVAAQPVLGTGRAARAAGATAADQVVAAVDRARPAGSTLLVVGLADTADPPHLHAVIAAGPDYPAGRYLTSASARRAPFVQLVDVAPTVVARLGLRSAPDMSGATMTAGPRHGDRFDTGTRSALSDQDLAAQAQRPLVQRFFTIMVVALLGLILLAWLFVFRRWPRPVLTVALPGDRLGASSRPGWSGRWRRAGRVLRAPVAVEVLGLALGAVPAGTFAANLVPWWRASHPALACLALTLGWTAGVLVLAYRGPWGNRPTGPVGCVAVSGALLLGLDLVTGANLQLDSIAGYSPLVAGRFAGLGNLGFGVFAASALIALGCLAQALRGWRRPVLFVGGGALAVVIVGAPTWGSDIGGILALAPAVLLGSARLGGRRLSLGLVAGAAVGGLAAVSAFAAADYTRPAEDRSHLGRFVAQLFDGTAGEVVQRKAEANLSLLVGSQLTWLVLAVLVFVPVVLLAPVGRLRRVHGLYPAVRGALVAVVVAAGLGFALNDSGIAVPAFVVMVALPCTLALTIRVTEAGRRRPARRHAFEPPDARPDPTGQSPVVPDGDTAGDTAVVPAADTVDDTAVVPDGPAAADPSNVDDSTLNGDEILEPDGSVGPSVVDGTPPDPPAPPRPRGQLGGPIGPVGPIGAAR